MRPSLEGNAANGAELEEKGNDAKPEQAFAAHSVNDAPDDAGHFCVKWSLGALRWRLSYTFWSWWFDRGTRHGTKIVYSARASRRCRAQARRPHRDDGGARDTGAAREHAAAAGQARPTDDIH